MSPLPLNPFKALARRRLEKALDLYAESPGIDETADVVRLLLKLRDYPTAFQYADNGYQRFPDSTELFDLRQSALRELSLEECRNLMARLASEPRPETVAKIVEIQRSLGEFRTCEKLARRWRARFPESWVLQFAIGKYLFQRSLIEKDKRISRRCLEQLEHAARLNPNNYKTLLYLATLLYQVGAMPRALETVERLLRHHPHDPKARALWDWISRAPDERAAGEETPDAEGADAAGLPAEFCSRDDVHGVVVQEHRGDREMISSRYSETAPFEFTAGDEIFSNLAHALRVSSNRMGLGDLKTCVLEGGGWKILFRNHGYRSLLVCADAEFRHEDFEKLAAEVAPEGVMP